LNICSPLGRKRPVERAVEVQRETGINRRAVKAAVCRQQARRCHGSLADWAPVVCPNWKCAAGELCPVFSTQGEARASQFAGAHWLAPLGQKLQQMAQMGKTGEQSMLASDAHLSAPVHWLHADKCALCALSVRANSLQRAKAINSLPAGPARSKQCRKWSCRMLASKLQIGAQWPQLAAQSHS